MYGFTKGEASLKRSPIDLSEFETFDVDRSWNITIRIISVATVLVAGLGMLLISVMH